MDILRQLDLDVAKKVLKFKVWWDAVNNKWLCYHTLHSNKVMEVPHYSTNLDLSYRIIYELKAKNYSCQIKSNPSNRKSWTVNFIKQGKIVYGTQQDTLPKAICISAINVVDSRYLNNTISNIIQFPKK